MSVAESRPRRVVPPPLPVATALFSVAAVTATYHERLGALLEDTRNLAATFEWWRPLTGHLVHAGQPHLLLNLLVFIPIAALRESRVGTRRFLVEFLTLAVLVAAGIRLLEGGWETYRGLSGVVYGLLTVVLLAPLRTNEERRKCGDSSVELPKDSESTVHERVAFSRRFRLTVVAVLATKSALEYGGGGWLVGTSWLRSSLDVTYLPGSHCAGILGGVGIAALFPASVGCVTRTRSAARSRSFDTRTEHDYDEVSPDVGRNA